jgi:hypothetical protein
VVSLIKELDTVFYPACLVNWFGVEINYSVIRMSRRGEIFDKMRLHEFWNLDICLAF